ncbi:MAG: hypothetical protein QMD65_02860 [Patescibacteria group bacterium]|nr:hypothetical protein [Patescibacteria group bacterium]
MKTKIESSENEKRLVETIEKIPIDDGNKVDLILVWQELKQATETEVNLIRWNPDEKLPQITEEQKQIIINNAESTFSSLGLSFIKGKRSESSYKYVDKPQKTGGAENQLFYVAKKEKDAKILSEIWQINENKNAGKLGRLFGFPESATKAYKKVLKEELENSEKHLINQGNLPKDIQQEDFMAFAQFRLSKNHWQKELETSKKWAKEIKRLDPLLYERVVRDHHDILQLETIRKFINTSFLKIEKELPNLKNNWLTPFNKLINDIMAKINNPDFKTSISSYGYEEILKNIENFKNRFTTLQQEYQNKKIIPENIKKELFSRLRILI